MTLLGRVMSMFFVLLFGGQGGLEEVGLWVYCVSPASKLTGRTVGTRFKPSEQQGWPSNDISRSACRCVLVMCECGDTVLLAVRGDVGCGVVGHLPRSSIHATG